SCFTTDMTILHILVVSSCSCYHQVLHAVPTRRSSDLPGGERLVRGPDGPVDVRLTRPADLRERLLGRRIDRLVALVPLRLDPFRSEEHTSELQSRENLVCRLLLEIKK